MKTAIRIKLSIILITFICLLPFSGQSQCFVDNTPDTIYSCYGDVFDITARGYCLKDTVFYDGFNSLSPINGWNSTLPLMIAPCPPNFSQDDSIVAWFRGMPWPRTAQLSSILVAPGKDHILKWEMKFGSAQGTAGMCEGPDMASEKVAVYAKWNTQQNWTQLEEYIPDPGNPYLEQWNTYLTLIPANGTDSIISLKWEQAVMSGEDFDTWGIDNVLICEDDALGYSLDPIYTWYENGVQVASSTNSFYPVVSSTPATYVLEISDNLNSVMDTIYLMPLPQINPGLVEDTILAMNASITLDAACQGCSYQWSNGATTSSITVDTSVATNPINYFYVTVTRGPVCEVIDQSMIIFTTGVGDEELKNDAIYVYPNPADDIIYIEGLNINGGKTSVEVLDINGRILVQDEISVSQTNPYRVDCAHLAEGLYVVKVITPEKSFLKKLVVHR